MRYDEATYDHAKALIADLAKAGFLPKAMLLDQMDELYDIVLRHVAMAEGKPHRPAARTKGEE